MSSYPFQLLQQHHLSLFPLSHHFQHQVLLQALIGPAIDSPLEVVLASLLLVLEVRFTDLVSIDYRSRAFYLDQLLFLGLLAILNE